ncbi:HNH endonuclease [Novosphingobium sp.]|uniref:HNH endonuclease n=1 Tax=Novosphingobium sp. TaxID=1874826 RepID=UPI003FA5EF18
MGVIAAAVEHLIAAGVTGSALVQAIADMEAAGCDAPRIQFDDRRRHPKPSGPLERWGYAGPQTPRLPHEEWLELRAKVLRRDHYTCGYCLASDPVMCVDHIIPLSRGGSNLDSNLVACCIPCNSSKSDRLPSEWHGRCP